MLLATIRFVRNPKKEREDDVIRIYDSDCNDLFRVTFCATDMKKPNQFFATRSWATGYVSEVLMTMTYDTAPFDSIQVDTAIHPSVLYHVGDMDDYEIRRLVEDTVDSALRHTIVKTDTEQSND
jgi:hypothetical protein